MTSLGPRRRRSGAFLSVALSWCGRLLVCRQVTGGSLAARQSLSSSEGPRYDAIGNPIGDLNSRFKGRLQQLAWRTTQQPNGLALTQVYQGITATAGTIRRRRQPAKSLFAAGTPSAGKRRPPKRWIQGQQE